MNRIKPLGILALLAAIAYVAIPLDGDNGWTGYIDDFFVFMAGYTFLWATDRNHCPTNACSTPFQAPSSLPECCR